MSVADWTLPDTQGWATWLEVIQSPDDLAICYGADLWSERHWELIAKSFDHIGRLGSRAVSQATRDLYHGLRDFLTAAAKEMGEAQRVEAELQEEYHKARLEAEKDELSKVETAALKSGLKEAQKIARMSTADALKKSGLPALAAIHGSPWAYDTYVPIFFAGGSIEARTVSRRVAPTDIAATIAAYLGIKYPSASVGTPLAEVIGGSD